MGEEDSSFILLRRIHSERSEESPAPFTKIKWSILGYNFLCWFTTFILIYLSS
jgi:hypothetical protein